MWSTMGSPNAGSYTVSWNNNQAGCSYEDVYPPYGYYVEVCTWLQEKAGSASWVSVGASGTARVFSGKAPGTYQYRLLSSFDGSAPYQLEWLPEVIVSYDPVVATTFRKCVASGSSTCDSAYKLEYDMNNSGLVSSLPYGTIIVSTSESVPISSILTICSSGGTGAKSACALIRTEEGMTELDNEIYARAAKVNPIIIPATTAPSAVSGGPEWEFIQQEAAVLTYVTHGTSILHSIWNWPQVAYVDFVDGRDGSPHRIWVGDTITVKFSDGSTAQLKLLGVTPVAGQFFHFVPGSERDANGNPVSAPTPAAANQVGNSGDALANVFASGDEMAISLLFTMCVSRILYEDAYGSGSFGRNYYPCLKLGP
jgi:hypothetical protein